MVSWMPDFFIWVRFSSVLSDGFLPRPFYLTLFWLRQFNSMPFCLMTFILKSEAVWSDGGFPETEDVLKCTPYQRYGTTVSPLFLTDGFSLGCLLMFSVVYILCFILSYLNVFLLVTDLAWMCSDVFSRDTKQIS